MRRGALITLAWWAAGAIIATVCAYLYALLRGDMLPNGTQGIGGPVSVWVQHNFRWYLPEFLAVGSALGVLSGLVHSAMDRIGR